MNTTSTLDLRPSTFRREDDASLLRYPDPTADGWVTSDGLVLIPREVADRQARVWDRGDLR